MLFNLREEQSFKKKKKHEKFGRLFKKVHP